MNLRRIEEAEMRKKHPHKSEFANMSKADISRLPLFVRVKGKTKKERKKNLIKLAKVILGGGGNDDEEKNSRRNK